MAIRSVLALKIKLFSNLFWVGPFIWSEKQHCQNWKNWIAISPFSSCYSSSREIDHKMCCINSGKKKGKNALIFQPKSSDENLKILYFQVRAPSASNFNIFLVYKLSVNILLKYFQYILPFYWDICLLTIGCECY